MEHQFLEERLEIVRGKNTKHIYKFFEYAREWDIQGITLLLEEGHVDPNKIYGTATNVCLLFHPIIEGKKIIFNLLLNYIHPNLYGEMTIIQILTSQGSSGQLELILKKGGNSNLLGKDKTKSQPIIMASSIGFNDKIELLLKYGADPNVRNDKGSSSLDILMEIYNHPFIFFPQSIQIENMEILLRGGARPDTDFLLTFEGTEYYERLKPLYRQNVKGLQSTS